MFPKFLSFAEWRKMEIEWLREEASSEELDTEDLRRDQVKCPECNGDGVVDCDCDCPKCDGERECDRCDGCGGIGITNLRPGEVSDTSLTIDDYLGALTSVLVRYARYTGKPTLQVLVDSGLEPFSCLTHRTLLREVVVVRDPESGAGHYHLEVGSV